MASIYVLDDDDQLSDSDMDSDCSMKSEKGEIRFYQFRKIHENGV